MQNSHFAEHLSMVASDNILWENDISFFEKFWSPQKNVSTCLFIPFLKYQVMKILLNNLLRTLCNLIVRTVTKNEEFYNKYLDWGCGNKWDQLYLENISSFCDTKLSALPPLSIAGVEGLWTISFFVKST